ncbi:hypothetical protein [Saccharopolyspora taberi]|uniref:Uncharacterized protein n=1 Tax=Saccharopolyspora taberi TaxID=60895 RepID=A0ABN3V0T7_9PSEU
MTIPNPWGEAQKSLQEPENGDQWARERAREHAGAGEYTAETDAATDNNVSWGPWPAQSDPAGDGAQSTEIAPRPTTGALVKVSEFGRDAWKSAKDVFDGTVYRTRPSAPRDRVERWRRAEWAGDVDTLRRVGKVLGLLPLVLSLLLDALRWLCTPLRFYVTSTIVLIVALIIIL